MTNLRLTSLIFSSFIVLSACATPSEAVPQAESSAQSTSAALTQTQRFEAWKQDFIGRAVAKGYDSTMVRNLILPAQISEKALDRDKTQPEFTQPVWTYVDNAVNATRLNGGRSQLSETRTVFDAIEQRYQVPRSLLTAIWGLESAYGKIQGNYDLISALSTFSFEGRRSAFGEQQLFAVLDMLQKGYVRPDQLKSSWAGAMGMTQFIPTTFRDYAVDFNGDGNKDLWQSKEDALGSAAHYLSRHGWEWQRPIYEEVELVDGFDYALSDGRKLSVRKWLERGVQVPVGARRPSSYYDMPAKLLVPAGHKGPKLLTFKNFDVIKRYNNSTSYALGIAGLGMALDGQVPIRTPWPREDEPLSRTDKENMQRRLTALGYDTKGVDGQIGPNSRKAIRAWQAANGLIPDGYVEQTIFKKIMGQ